MRLSLLALLPMLPAAVGLRRLRQCRRGGRRGRDDDERRRRRRTHLRLGRKAARAEASARFIRVTAPASTDDALRAIGASLELPARGSCAAIASLAESPVARPPIVELLDVGEVTPQADGVRDTPLAARQLPDVTDVGQRRRLCPRDGPSLLPPRPRATMSTLPGRRGTRAHRHDRDRARRSGRSRSSGEDTSGTLVVAGARRWTSRGSGQGCGRRRLRRRPPERRPVRARRARATAPCRRCSSTRSGRSSCTACIASRSRRRGIDTGEVRFDFARTISYVRR